MLGFGEAVGLYYRNFFNFQGRASRAEFWWPFLMRAILHTGLIVAFLATIDFGAAEGDEFSEASLGVLVAWLVFYLVNIIPNLSIAARRFHDLGQTGWLVLVFVILNAVVGLTWFAQMIWFAFPGDVGPNAYGADPFGYDTKVFG